MNEAKWLHLVFKFKFQRSKNVNLMNFETYMEYVQPGDFTASAKLPFNFFNTFAIAMRQHFVVISALLCDYQVNN